MNPKWKAAAASLAGAVVMPVVFVACGGGGGGGGGAEAGTDTPTPVDASTPPSKDGGNAPAVDAGPLRTAELFYEPPNGSGKTRFLGSDSEGIYWYQSAADRPFSDLLSDILTKSSSGPVRTLAAKLYIGNGFMKGDAFWLTTIGLDTTAGHGTWNQIAFVPRNGGGATAILSTPNKIDPGPFVDDSGVYYSVFNPRNTIHHVDANGANDTIVGTQPDDTTSQASFYAPGLVGGAADVFWPSLAQPQAHEILWKLSKAGGTATPLYTATTGGTVNLQYPSVVGSDVLIDEFGRGIVRVPISGGAATVVVPKIPNGTVGGYTTDATHLYWSESDIFHYTSIRRMPLAGGPSELLVTARTVDDEAGAMLTDATHVYWLDSKSRIVRAAK